MTEDERKVQCGNIVCGVIRQIYPHLKKQYFANAAILDIERRMGEIRDKILAGDEKLLNQYSAMAQKWGMAVMGVCAGDKEEPPAEAKKIGDPVVSDNTPKQVNMF